MTFISNVLTVVLLLVVTRLTRASIPYNTTTQACCNGTVIDKLGSKSISCCGSTAYDFSTTLCCAYNKVLEVPRGNDTRYYGCCLNETTATYSIFRYDKQKCCSGNVLDKPDSIAPYDCCNGKLYERIGSLDCCADQELFNSVSHICCTKYDNVAKALQFQISVWTSNTIGCCGLKPLDFRSDVCCGGVLTPRTEDMSKSSRVGCCNGVPFDPKKKICCEKWGKTATNKTGIVASALHDIKDNTTECCGASTYDFRKEICCGVYEEDKIVAKPEGSSERLVPCCGDRPITNSTTQYCHKNKLYERKNSHYYVCGDQLFDHRKQFCCANRVLDINSKHNDCCTIQV